MSTVIVGVQYKPKGKVYYFDPKGIDFQKGEGVIVETAQGQEYGTIAIANKPIDDSLLKGELKPVIRKATEKDVKQHESLMEKRTKYMADAQSLIEKHKLDMKLVDADIMFDGSKIIVYFTSENRVDFRDLVKDMASQFRMRIELRQIGIRDECKMKGGLGPCGRVCCCNSHLDEFARVSIKMAKYQGLSINPTKISGLCGRLMCCLKYEDDYYAQTLKFMPKVNSEINTPDGKGKVESVDILHQTVRVRITRADESVEISDYTLPQLGIVPVYKEPTTQTPADDDDLSEE